MSIATRRHQRGVSKSVASTLYSLWPSNPTPQTPSTSDEGSVEVGVKFSSTSTAEITAIRFYKGSQNTGTHSVSLWKQSGALIKSAVAIGETASGWQTVYFNTPVPILANTLYVASYFAPNGHYSSSSNYFLTSGTTSGILNAPRTTVSLNGLYKYGSSSVFPDKGFSGANYWVDVIARPFIDTTTPTAPSSLNAVPLGTRASLSWTAATDDIGVESYFIFRNGSQVGSSTSTNFVDTTTTATTAYTYTVRAVDYGGNQSSLSNTASVTTGTNAAPIAAFTIVSGGRSISVDGTTSSDPDGSIAQYAWNFGDGATTTGSTASHTYASDGTYSVQLTVTDTQSATNSVSHNTTLAMGSFIANVIDHPSFAGYPDETNTGVPVGTTLTNDSGGRIEQDGMILENLYIEGGLSINANNVTIRNCHIVCNGYYPIVNYGLNLLVEDCEIEGTNLITTSSIAFGEFTIRRCNIHGGADGIKADNNALIEDCFIHSLAVGEDSHNDGIQTTDGSNVTVRHNTIRLGDQDGINACIQMGDNNSNWLVEDNLFDGGGYIINGYGDPGEFTGMNVLNNRFTRRSQYGVGGISDSIWVGNYFDDDGSPA